MMLFQPPTPPIPNTGWTAPTEFPRLEAATVIALDTETKDPELSTKGPGWARGGSHLAGVSCAAPGVKPFYLPMRHELGGGNLPPDIVLKWCKRELCREGQPKIGANILYDIGGLMAEGVDVKGPFIDVLYAAAVLDEHMRKYDLDTVAEVYLGEKKTTNALYDWIARTYSNKSNPRADIYRSPVALVGPYAEGDADLPLRIWAVQKPMLEGQGLLDLFYMECALIPILVKMQMRGVPINQDGLDPAIDKMRSKMKEARQGIKKLVGFEVDHNSSDQLVRAFEKLGLDYRKTAKGNPSFTKDFLENHPHEIGAQIREIRRWEKYLQYAESYRDKFAVNGIIHGGYHPLRGDEGGTIVGRFSSCLPDTAIITTEQGDRALATVRTTDRVLTHTGRFCHVLNKWFTGEHKTFKISLDSGHELVCTSNHRLLTTHGWLSLEDIYERLYAAPTGPDHLSESCSGISWRGEANDAGGSRCERDYLPHYASDIEAGYSTGEIERGAGYPLLEEQEGPEQSVVRGCKRSTPTIQGRDLGRERLSHNIETRMVHREAWEQARLCTSCGNVQGVGDNRDPSRVPCSPHKRGQDRQQDGESSIGIRVRSSGNTQVFTNIRKVEYVGITRVYDLEVAEDHCFVADGVYVHNSKPNLTNIPKRDKEAKKILRSLFTAFPGERWRSRDYSQIQFRIMVHYAIGSGADEVRQMYCSNPDTDHHDLVLDMVAPYAGWDTSTTELHEQYRGDVKNVNFALAFTGGLPTLVKQLGRPKAEVEELLSVYHGALPWLKATSNRVEEVAKERGYIKGILGRRHRFPLWQPKCWALKDYFIPSPDREDMERKIDTLLRDPPKTLKGSRLFGGTKRAYTHLGLNRLAQDGEGSTVKKAMVDCYEAGIFDVIGVPLLTVHDDIAMSDPMTAESEDAFREMLHIMQTCINWKVPIRVGDEVGPTWANLEALK